MPTFFSDPSGTHFVLLVVFLVITLGLWWRNRDRRSLALLVVAALLLGGLLLCDELVESPREEAVRRVGEVEAAINAHRWADAMPHFAESFQHKSLTKSSIARLDRINHVQRVATWDFTRDQVEYVSDRKIVIGFMGKAVDAGEFAAYFRVTFEPQSDGAWKITTFDAYDPVRRAGGEPISIPGL